MRKKRALLSPTRQLVPCDFFSGGYERAQQSAVLIASLVDDVAEQRRQMRSGVSAGNCEDLPRGHNLATEAAAIWLYCSWVHVSAAASGTAQSQPWLSARPHAIC